jgi:hypothetical protein
MMGNTAASVYEAQRWLFEKFESDAHPDAQQALFDQKYRSLQLDDAMNLSAMYRAECSRFE